jgi:hypothetical protein
MLDIPVNTVYSGLTATDAGHSGRSVMTRGGIKVTIVPPLLLILTKYNLNLLLDDYRKTDNMSFIKGIKTRSC